MNERIVKKGRKEFRKLVSLNGGVDKFLPKPSRWNHIHTILATSAIWGMLRLLDWWLR